MIILKEGRPLTFIYSINYLANKFPLNIFNIN